VTIDVHFLRAASYADPGLEDAAAGLVEALHPRPFAGAHVLVKPNMVSPRNAGLSHTHPAVVRAACLACLAKGARVTVGDSPAFATAGVGARASGLRTAIRDLPVRLVTLGRATRLPLTRGGHTGISRDALEADLLLNLPRLKAHGQMRLTAGVKNLFGCVPGPRKALAHARLGDKGQAFASMIVDVAQALPRAMTLLDAVTCMHVTGPSGGKPFDLGLIGASASPFALDTALYVLLGLEPAQVPVWREARQRGIPGARAEDLAYPALSPAGIDARGFEIPRTLDAESFHPLRLAWGRCKSVVLRLKH
jgi:uncharacterized protein (DUF362 family)